MANFTSLNYDCGNCASQCPKTGRRTPKEVPSEGCVLSARRCGCVSSLNLTYKGTNTIYALNIVESERDEWQRPSEVISRLSLKSGDIVADVGSGAGYFSLKLSPVVGRSGTVLAVDVRKPPLVFLWIRALLAGLHNIRIRVGESDAPHLPVGTVDAVLIANTYHEFTAPEL